MARPGQFSWHSHGLLRALGGGETICSRSLPTDDLVRSRGHTRLVGYTATGSWLYMGFVPAPRNAGARTRGTPIVSDHQCSRCGAYGPAVSVGRRYLRDGDISARENALWDYLDSSREWVDVFLCDECFAADREVTRHPARVSAVREMIAGLDALHRDGTIGDAEYEARVAPLAIELCALMASSTLVQPKSEHQSRPLRRHWWKIITVQRTGIDGQPFRVRWTARHGKAD
jgi:hypothetical protein